WALRRIPESGAPRPRDLRAMLRGPSAQEADPGDAELPQRQRGPARVWARGARRHGIRSGPAGPVHRPGVEGPAAAVGSRVPSDVLVPGELSSGPEPRL